jgi:hypothetical protein
MLNHFFHRALLQEFSVPVAVHAIIFVLTTVGVCAENLVSQWHSATLTESHFFHIPYFVLSFDAARLVQAALDLWSLATEGTQELLRRRRVSRFSTAKVMIVLA